MALLDAVQRFADVFNQEEKNFGTLTVRTQEKAIPEELLAAGELRTFYANVDFDKLTIGNTFFMDIATLGELPRYQEGWRWVYDLDPAGSEDTEYWQASWLVFGDRHGDALFAKLASSESPIFGSIQKTEEYQLASSLESFFLVMTACLVMERAEFQNETKLPDYSIKAEFIDRTRELVSAYESPEITEQFIQFFFS